MISLDKLSDRSSDRSVLLATLLSGITAFIMLVFEVLDQFRVLDEHLPVMAWGQMISEAMVVGSVIWGGALALRVMKKTRAVGLKAIEAGEQVETLFKMTDMLQSALGYSDANAVLRTTASKLMPDFGGALYIFNNSGDRLELSTHWAFPEGAEPVATISPSQCWALKRGKTHFNFLGAGALRCPHNGEDAILLEIPMMARGEVYGLLQVQASSEKSEEKLEAAAPIATALADAMSLALSNIALREKLRTQALRDPLTGLYNRRYMEDVLERYAALAERNQSTLAVVMFDLDHFKRLNDEHGHALGDAVLASVAAAVLGTIRPSDIACRYGGEEFVVLLPECTMDEAAVRAEALRARIERVSENHGVRVSASFGIAGIPESSAKTADVLGEADEALYRAKAEGRNRVCTAGKRPSRIHPDRKAAA